MSTMKCEDCAWWVPYSRMFGGTPKKGQCHGGPPSVSCTYPGMSSDDAVFPVTNADAWCADFQEAAETDK